MEIKETVSIPPKPAKTKEMVTHCLCDLCGAKGDPEYDGEVEWENKTDHDEVKTFVAMAKGYTYSDGGSWDRTLFHICPACFEKKLVPWLESQGAKATKTNSDY
jgi:hypothetical protein